MNPAAEGRALRQFAVLAEDGTPHDPGQALPGAQFVLGLYQMMRRARRFDERMLALHRQGRIGFHGASTGQEAPPIAAALALKPQDWVFPALRESALLLARGFPLSGLLAQSFGNALDNTRGRQMPSHPASRAFHHVSWSSAIATQLPHAVGAALAAKRLGKSDVMLAFLGDGATSHPDFHGALNFAGVFRAPVVFVCQNNQYAISVPLARQTRAETLALKALSYGILADRVDGNDAIAVFQVLTEALLCARRGQGPRFVECVTYRVGPHSTSDDPDRYRAPAEVFLARQKDPILRLSRFLSSRGLGSEAQDQAIDRAFDADFDAALSRVEGAPAPSLDSMFDDVYAERPWHLREQRRACEVLGR